MTSLPRKTRPRWALASPILFGLGACSVAQSGGDENRLSEGSTDSSDEISLDPGDPDYGKPLVLGETDGQGGAGGASADACLNLLSFGSVAQMGAVPGESGMDAIVHWLNESSTASAVHFAEKPPIDSDLFRNVDVVLLQDMSSWEISDDEAAVFKTWVHEGGSVMALSGYGTDGVQVGVTNRLLSFTGMNFLTAGQDGDTSTNVGACGFCLGTTAQQGGWSKEHPIGFGVETVGAYMGRAIQGEGDVVAQEEGRVLAMAHLAEKGRAFLFHDEWISYVGQWNQDAPAQCLNDLACSEVSPRKTYQVAQLWYNALR